MEPPPWRSITSLCLPLLILRLLYGRIRRWLALAVRLRAVAGGGEHAAVPQEGAKVEEEGRSQNVSQTPPLRDG